MKKGEEQWKKEEEQWKKKNEDLEKEREEKEKKYFEVLEELENLKYKYEKVKNMGNKNEGKMMKN